MYVSARTGAKTANTAIQRHNHAIQFLLPVTMTPVMAANIHTLTPQNNFQLGYSITQTQVVLDFTYFDV